MPVLKLREHDEKREIAFETAQFKNMSLEQLFNMMLEKSKIMMELLKKHGYSGPPQIIKRT